MTVETTHTGGMARSEAVGETEQVVLPVRGMTCHACVRHVGAALESVPGVVDARVDLASNLAFVRFEAARTSLSALQDAVESAGYVPGEPVSGPAHPIGPGAGEATHFHPPAGGRVAPVVFGLIASSALAAFYLGIVSLAQGFDHATELLREDWYFVVPIVLGFGLQMGLFVYLRRAARRHGGTRSATAIAGVGTGTSSVSMVACCAHHLSDLLPLIGISGAALFLNDYRQPLMVLGIVSNLAGITMMLRMIRRRRAA